MAFGLDWAWGNPNLTAMKKAGVKFACRYLSYDASKNLDLAEAKRLKAAGIDIVVIWETTANRALSGRLSGKNDAKAALAQAKACGIPAGRPIYFAVDFDETPARAKVVAEYFKGVHDVLDHVGPAGQPRSYPVGAYGGYWAIKRLFDAKLIDYGWQTYAWSGGNWDKRAQLQQYSNGHRLGNVSCDFNRSMKPDYGQWGYGARPAQAKVSEKTKARWRSNIMVLARIIKAHPKWPKSRLDGLRGALKRYREALKRAR